MKLSGWGRYPTIEATLVRPDTAADVSAAITAAASLIARGNGRSYGDAALNAACTLDMRRLNRLLAFDPETGLLACEAGTLLADIVAVFLPRGWFPPVTPGTRLVTVGGMVAADVHGKNHHGAGSFGDHVAWLDLALADGTVARCAPDRNRDLFDATIGGMGLTGVILAVAFRLRRVETDLIRQTILKARDLEEAMALFAAHRHATYSVAWIDCLARGDRLGRSLILLGEHVAAADLPAGRRDRPFEPPKRRAVTVPFDLPAVALNGRVVAAFNSLYYRRGKPGASLVGIEPYFYPLDAIGHWNRLYGRGGFVQYQFVLPLAASGDGMRAILSRIAAAGRGSFLAVLKPFGKVATRPASLSFPREGYTLALDFPATAATFSLLAALDAIVADLGGRLYLAKDARGPAAMLAGYPELDAFRAVRDRVDPTHRFSSLQSQRIGL